MKKKQKIIRSKIKPYPETHQRGMIEVNLTDEISWQKIKNVQFGLHDLGVQIAEDGRVWICIDGVSFLRFKPSIRIETKQEECLKKYSCSYCHALTVVSNPKKCWQCGRPLNESPTKEEEL